MRILNLKNDILNIVTAFPFTTKKGDKYYNIKIGKFKKPFIGSTIHLDAKDFPVIDNTPITLDKNNYRVIPITNKNLKLKKDSVGNPIINIKSDNELNNKDDIMLIIDIPYDKKEFLSITTKGDVEKIMEAKNGCIWFDKTYSSPVIVYLLYKNSEIIYKYKQSDESIVEVIFIKNDNQIETKRIVHDKR